MKPRKQGLGSRAPVAADRQAPQRRRWVAATLVIAAGIFLAAGLYVLRPAPLVDLDAVLIQQGFIPNPGFTAVFRPGDVIQIAERDDQGRVRQLSRPVLFLKRESCFPGLSPGEVPFGMPAISGHRSLTLDGARLGRVLPQLRVGGREIHAYSLVVENARVATFAKGELSEQFAPSCVESFARALAGGDLAAWFGTVVETVIADGLTLTVDWQAGTTGVARAAFRRHTAGALPARGAVSTELDSSEKTVLRAAGPLVLGYRYRPMEPVHEELK